MQQFKKRNLDLVIKKEIWLSGAHVTGARNTVEDFSSKVFHDNKWSISNEVTQLTFETFRKLDPDTDLFAS